MNINIEQTERPSGFDFGEPRTTTPVSSDRVSAIFGIDLTIKEIVGEAFRVFAEPASQVGRMMVCAQDDTLSVKVYDPRSALSSEERFNLSSISLVARRGEVVMVHPIGTVGTRIRINL